MTAAGFDPVREIDRMFNAVTRSPASLAMPMDVYHDEDRFIAAIDLPGVDVDSIDIDVDDRTLTIRAQRRQGPSGQVQWLTRERGAGAFARQLSLGRGLATDKIVADYTDGVLTLTIPVAEEAKPRKIAVNHGAGHAVQGQLATSGSDAITQTSHASEADELDAQESGQ